MKFGEEGEVVASRSKDLKMNKRTVICCLFALCNTIAVLAAPTIDSATTTTAECINNDSTRRIWPDFSVIGRYINPFDWIGKPVISKPKRYDWALEKDSKSPVCSIFIYIFV